MVVTVSDHHDHLSDCYGIRDNHDQHAGHHDDLRDHHDHDQYDNNHVDLHDCHDDVTAKTSVWKTTQFRQHKISWMMRTGRQATGNAVAQNGNQNGGGHRSA